MRELLELDCAVTLAFNPSDYGDELLVARIEAILLQESVEVEMINEALPLAVQEVEGSSGVPVRQLVQLMLKHLDLDVHVQLSLEEVSQAFLDRRVQPLAALDIDLKGLPLAHIFPQLWIIARQHEFHELRIRYAATVVQIVELHHQLHVFDAELRTVVLLQVLVDVPRVDDLVAVAVDSAEGSVRLEVVEVGELLPRALHAEL